MNSIKYACSLNNQGVDLRVSGESSRAMEAFQNALSLLKAVHEAAETISCAEVNISCDDAPLPFWESTSTVSGLQGLHYYVYDHGIMISDNAKSDTDETLSLYIAIVLLNLVLAFHSEGTALGREKSLMKASALYSLVVKFLTRCTMLNEDMSTNILTLLTLNNKAQIHHDQCEYVHSDDRMKEISKIMGSVHGLHSALSHEGIEGLLLNEMLLSTPTAAQAA